MLQPWRGPCLLFMVLLLSACASGPIAPAAGTTPTTPGRVAAERDAYRAPEVSSDEEVAVDVTSAARQ